MILTIALFIIATGLAAGALSSIYLFSKSTLPSAPRNVVIIVVWNVITVSVVLAAAFDRIAS